MAYFSNGSGAMFLADQCSTCRIGIENYCPVAFVQQEYNYSQNKEGNVEIKNILNFLVNEKGICEVRRNLKLQLPDMGSLGLSVCCGHVKEEAIVCSKCKNIT